MIRGILVKKILMSCFFTTGTSSGHLSLLQSSMERLLRLAAMSLGNNAPRTNYLVPQIYFRHKSLALCATGREGGSPGSAPDAKEVYKKRDGLSSSGGFLLKLHSLLILLYGTSVFNLLLSFAPSTLNWSFSYQIIDHAYPLFSICVATWGYNTL